VKALETEIDIRGSAMEVWSVLADFRRYPEWNPFIREASGEVRRGARLTVQLHPPGGRPMTFRPIVREASPGRELRWEGHLWFPGLFDGEHVFRIETTGENVRLRHGEQFRGVLVPLIPANVFERTRRGFEAMNRALKERIETR
jgi:hypothetical protein